MSPAIEVVVSGESRRLQPRDEPVSIGGPGSDIEVAGSEDGPAAYLGFDGDKLFIQPAEDAVSLACNGVPLATSRWYSSVS